MKKINLDKILEEQGSVRKFVGVAPEGFILVHEKTLQGSKNPLVFYVSDFANQGRT